MWTLLIWRNFSWTRSSTGMILLIRVHSLACFVFIYCCCVCLFVCLFVCCSVVGRWDHVVEGLFTTGLLIMEHFSPKSACKIHFGLAHTLV